MAMTRWTVWTIILFVLTHRYFIKLNRNGTILKTNDYKTIFWYTVQKFELFYSAQHEMKAIVYDLKFHKENIFDYFLSNDP